VDEMIEFKQATREGVLSIFPQLQQNNEMAAIGRDAFARNLIPLDERAIAVYDGDQCIGAYGIVELWPGVARVWALFSDTLIENHPVLLGLHARRDIQKADQFGFHRIEATADAEHKNAAVFLKGLGFDLECCMRRYTTDGKDTYLYARVKDA
jgi:hypothetical protein